MKKIHRFLAASIFILISLVSIENVFAGAWTVPKHKVWSEYYMKWNWGKEYFNSDWKKKKLNNDARSWEFVQEPKLEFGVTDSLTALTSIEYKEAHYKEYGRPYKWNKGMFTHSNTGLTAVKVGGRWRFMDVPFVMSTQTKVFIYPGYPVDHGDDPGYTNSPSIGHGDDAVEQRILIGKVFSIPLTGTYKLPCYWGAETGYRWRTKHVSNDIPYFLEGGFWPAPWLLVKSELDGYITAGTEKIKESYGIWRIGGVWQIFGGDSVLRQGNKLFNIELQYGMTLWGKNTTLYQEWVCKVQTQF